MFQDTQEALVRCCDVLQLGCQCRGPLTIRVDGIERIIDDDIASAMRCETKVVQIVRRIELPLHLREAFPERIIAIISELWKDTGTLDRNIRRIVLIMT